MSEERLSKEAEKPCRRPLSYPGRPLRGRQAALITYIHVSIWHLCALKQTTTRATD